MPKKIVAIKTKEGFDPKLIFRKLEEFGFRFDASRDTDVNSVAMCQYYGSGPFFYVFFSQAAGRQWSMYPGNDLHAGLEIDPEIYDARITTAELLTKKDVEFLQTS